MMALPTIFEMNFVEVWQSSQTCRFFLNRRGEPGVVLMSPNAIAKSHYGDTNEIHFFHLPHHAEQILYKASTSIMHA
jgi:hypothetical protein